MAWIYAVYKGDDFICDGTPDEICKKINIKKATFQFYRSNIYKKRIKYGKLNSKATIIIRIDGKDKIFG